MAYIYILTQKKTLFQWLTKCYSYSAWVGRGRQAARPKGK